AVHAPLLIAEEEHAKQVLDHTRQQLPSAARDVQLALPPYLEVLGPLCCLDLALDAYRLEVLLNRFGELRALGVVDPWDRVRIEGDRLAPVLGVLQECLCLLGVVRVALQRAIEAPGSRREHPDRRDARAAVELVRKLLLVDRVVQRM